MKWIILAVLCVTSVAAAELECYNCVEGVGASGAIPLCSQTDSPLYKQRCINSTMCVELRTETTTNGQTTKSSTYGCANATKVKELLDKDTVPEGSCLVDSSNKDPYTEYSYCFCKGKLCNDPKSKKNSANSLNSLAHLKLVFNLFLLISFSKLF